MGAGARMIVVVSEGEKRTDDIFWISLVICHGRFSIPPSHSLTTESFRRAEVEDDLPPPPLRPISYVCVCVCVKIYLSVNGPA